MGDMLSQAEIDALLSGAVTNEMIVDAHQDGELTEQEIDALGEIGNISMGTSATTLFTLLGHKVTITTPKVTVTTWEGLASEYTSPYVAVNVEYTKGLIGSNLLILKENDVKIITDLMMGGEGKMTEGELTDLHLSAISEAMNQMVGSSATSMSSMFNKEIYISPPKPFIIHFDDKKTYADFDTSQTIVCVAFKMVVGTLIDSEIMQILPIKFARELVENLLSIDMDNPYDYGEEASQISHKRTGDANRNIEQNDSIPPIHPSSHANDDVRIFENKTDQESYYDMHGYNRHQKDLSGGIGNVNVQPAQFQSFGDETVTIDKKNISLIMDVPLQVTVELGRTNKLIRDILEFASGSIIELDKLAGEPVDILVNGKPIAKGEVVVIDESFGVRVTDIIHPSKRI